MRRNEPVAFDDYYMRVTPRFDVPDLPPGHYRLRVTAGAESITRPVERLAVFVRENHTRFFLLEHAGSKARVPVGSGRKPWKTSLVFSTRNIPGALFRALGALALRDINLVKIESGPLRGKPWEYLFYLDLIGHRDDQVVRNALSHLGELADFLRVLGSYRAA